MALKQASQIVQKLPVISASGYEPCVIVGDYTTVAGDGVLNDVIELGILPAGYVPVDAILASEDLDSNGAPTVTLDLGILSGTAGEANGARTCASEGFSASTVGQAGGIARPTKKDWALIAPTDADRGIGVKLAAATATLVVGAKLRLTIIARPALNGV